MPVSANFRREMLMAIKDAKKKRNDQSLGDEENAAPSNNARADATPAMAVDINYSTEKIKSQPSDTTNQEN
ncbi:hypothetical protein HW555_010219 [Spodoptera exigua]|uniref:Uncharacterized protein n=1 Tax=Spodoptera exigua TaxID=7107 RepID=A0A835L2S2_SPOEX|nr:hypothetical protein HW555_010219 [Spodoptera exigua]